MPPSVVNINTIAIKLEQPAACGNKAAHHLEHGRFPATRRAEQGNQVAFTKLERNVLHRRHRLPGGIEGLRHVDDAPEGCRCASTLRIFCYSHARISLIFYLQS